MHSMYKDCLSVLEHRSDRKRLNPPTSVAAGRRVAIGASLVSAMWTHPLSPERYQPCSSIIKYSHVHCGLQSSARQTISVMLE